MYTASEQRRAKGARTGLAGAMAAAVLGLFVVSVAFPATADSPPACRQAQANVEAANTALQNATTAMQNCLKAGKGISGCASEGQAVQAAQAAYNAAVKARDAACNPKVSPAPTH